MKIKIIAVGKIKESFYKEAIKEYEKRLTPFCSIETLEVKEADESGLNKKTSPQIINDKEAQLIVSKIKQNDYVIALDLHGKEYSSEEFATNLEKIVGKGNSNIAFVISGSYGIGQALKERTNEFICLSKMTFTHQMTRVILIEQIYRSFNILKGTNYHK